MENGSNIDRAFLVTARITRKHSGGRARDGSMYSRIANRRLGSLAEDNRSRKKSHQGEGVSPQGHFGDRLFHSWFDDNPLPMMAVDRETLAILAVNESAIRRYGYPREEFLALTAKDIRPPEDAERLSEALREGDRGFTGPFRGRHRGKDGTIFEVEIYSCWETWEGKKIIIAQIQDVTERKRAEARSRWSLLEALPDAMMMVSLESKIVLVNAKLEEMFGYLREELLGQEIKLLIPERLREAHLALEKSYFAHPRTRPLGECINVAALRKDGTEFPAEISLSPLENEEGPLVLAAIRDTTERMCAEEEFHRREEQLRILFESVSEYAIFQLDPNGKVSSWSPAAERIKGYPAEEIVGRHFSCFYTQEDTERGRPQQLLRLAASQGRAEDEAWRVRKDGSRFWANVVISSIRGKSGDLVGFVNVTRDFTERKRGEESLLLEVSNTLLTNLDITKLLSSVSAAIKKMVPHDFATLALHDAETGKLRLQLLDIAYEKQMPARELAVPVEDSAPGWVFRMREPLILDRLDTGRFKRETIRHLVRAGLKSACWVPLLSQGRALGVLALGSRREAAFTSNDLAVLAGFANRVGVVLDNTLAFRQLSEMRERLRQEKLYLEEELQTEYNFEEIVGESRALKRVLKQVELVASSDATVLILGDTGTGKELIARAIHRLSARQAHAFIKLSCAAIPAGLLESELFGHERGAYTGAIAQRVGRLELAHQGTLFLDEVGDLPMELQPKLLRVLQEREIERLGSARTIPVDVRLVAATNRNLEKMVAKRQFRSDLYYRLKVFPIRVPSLRERAEDIPHLVRYFVSQYGRRMNKRIESVPDDVMRALCRWHWPGNVRELENFIERAVILTRGPALRAPLSELTPNGGTTPAILDTTLEAAEREHIVRMLRETHGVIGGPRGAAVRLGLRRTTLNAKIKKLGIRTKDYI